MAAKRSILTRALAVLAVTVLGALVAPVPAHADGASTSVYLAPWGDDRAGGRTWWQPVRSLERARDLVRALVPGMTGDITVRLFPGEYPLTQPLHLDARDSGTGGHRVVWTSLLPRLPATVSGGTPVTRRAPPHPGPDPLGPPGPPGPPGPHPFPGGGPGPTAPRP